MSVRFLACADAALVVEFGDRIDRALSDRVLRLERSLRAALIEGVVETVPTFRSLLIHYDPLRIGAAALEQKVASLIDQEQPLERTARLWRVPVCYAPSLAPDLVAVADRTGLTPDAVAAIHAGCRYHVYMVGFLPGYGYMGDLPEALRLPRRTDPRVRVPTGAVAIATALTAIYALESPGGWHLIGATPIRPFDPRRTPPVLFQPGDGVAFEPIGEAEYQSLRTAARDGGYLPPSEALAP
jgi:KipI family sensor histidine kinase inhibitor